MKNSLKIRSVLLASAMVLSLSSCAGGGGGRTEPDGTAAGTTTSVSASATTLDTDENLQNIVAEKAEDTKLEGLEVTKKIKWLSWWDIDESAAEAELFKAQYGIPEKGNTSYGADFANEIFVWTNVAYADRYDRLGQLVAAGDSPDMFPFEIGYFPLSAYMKMFQPIDGIVDTTTEDWSVYRDTMDQFLWDGKNWCATASVTTGALLWYRRSVAEEVGLTDPYVLYQNGEWTWDAFLQMAKTFQESGESKYVIDGWNTPDYFIGTTGVPLVSIENGKLKSNLNDPAIERAMALVENLAKEDYRYPWDLNGYSTNFRAWMNGDTLFFIDGTWMFEGDTMQKAIKKFGWAEDEVFFVPFPRDPSADQYYQVMTQNAFMLCGGATNVPGFQAWTNCVLTALKDPDVIQAQQEKSQRDYGWSDEQLDFLEELRGTLVPVWDFKNGISVTCAQDGMEDSPTRGILGRPYTSPDQTYMQVRAELENSINSQIEQANSLAG